MLKYYLFAILVLVISIDAKYISKDKIDKEKKSLQVSSCEDRTCVKLTQEALEPYEFITIIEQNYYVTYLVNIDEKDEEKIMSRYKDSFPDMILRKRYVENKELYALKALDEDFYNNKNYKTKVKTKKVDIYSKPSYESEKVDTKFMGEQVDIDGCNVYEWCKQKDEKKYLPLYKINPYTKIKKQEPKKEEIIVVNTSKFLDKYKLALNLYKGKKYKEAKNILQELFLLKPDEKNINYYIARSSYELGEYNEALLAYERVLFEKETPGVKLEMAKTMFMLKNYLEAKYILLALKNDSSISEKRLKVVEYYLRLIDQKIKKHFINGILMAGITYDSNINSRSKYDTFSNIYISSFDLYLDFENTTEDDEAVYNQELALLKYYYKINDTKKFKQDFMLYNKDSFASSFNSTDVTLLNYSPAISIDYSDKLNIDYALYADTMWYGNEKYLNTIALYPKVKYIYDKNNMINGYLKYQKKSYQQESNEKRDSFYTEIGTSLIHIYSPKVSFKPSITLKNEEKISGSQEGIDYMGIKLGFASTYKHTPTLTFTPSFSYDYDRYEGENSYYLTKQVDKEYKAALSTTYVLKPKWILQGNANFTYQSSTIDMYEYDKYTLAINLIRTF